MERMIEVLFPVVMAEMLVTILLLFRTPMRKLVVMALDRVKRGKGSLVAKTVALTIFVVFLSALKNIIDIAGRQAETAAASRNPTDQVLMARHLLHVSLMGIILFLGVIIDRLHHYIREIRLLKKMMLAGNSVKRSPENANNSSKGLCKKDFKAMSAEIASLKNKVQTLVPFEPPLQTPVHTD